MMTWKNLRLAIPREPFRDVMAGMQSDCCGCGIPPVLDSHVRAATPICYAPAPDGFLAPSADRASSSILIRDSAAANACSASESAGITT
jgi:hypothetical protein